MVLELHVWGPAFGLPSIEADCIATIAYCQQVLPKGQWTLVTDYDAAVTAIGTMPLLYDDGIATATGFEDIVAYLRNHPASTEDLDANFTESQLTDMTAFITFLHATATPLIDVSLYVSAENYNTTTSSAYTAILPWYANYTVPPRRRDLARTRTAQMGLDNLDITSMDVEGFAPGRGTASSEYEAAKKAAGIPTGEKSGSLRLGRGRGIGGFLSTPTYAARFRLDTLSNELLIPLAELLGKKDFLLRGNQMSSLDCLAYGYLSLLFYPQVPQAWLKEIIQTKFPKISSYISRLREHIFSSEVINPAEVWSLSTGSTGDQLGTSLPWQQRSLPFASKVLVGARQIFVNIPVVSSLTQRTAVVDSQSHLKARNSCSALPSPLLMSSLLGVAAAAAVGFVSVAAHHRRSPRDGALIFWALRPATGPGEAGDILSVLANNLPTGAALAQL